MRAEWSFDLATSACRSARTGMHASNAGQLRFHLSGIRRAGRGLRPWHRLSGQTVSIGRA